MAKIQTAFLIMICWCWPLWVASAQVLPPQAAVATAHPLATAVGHEVLAQGGNAFDAAVAISAVLAVVEPYSSGIGGGGFYLLYRADTAQYGFIDARETAPSAATEKMYLDKQGNLVPETSVNGPLAAGIPGIPAALEYLTQHYAKLSLAHNLKPAMQLAKKGFPVDEYYRRMVQFRLLALQQSPAAAKQFLDQHKIPALGYRLKQSDLARTLALIAEHGKAGFYEGVLAQKLIKGVKEAGGIWQSQDLAQYHVILRTPLIGQYQNIRLITAPPPSSGGVALLTLFNILSPLNLNELNTTDRNHMLVEAMRRVYRDRAAYLGDPDFVKIPVEQLIHPFYAAGLAAGIHPHKATPSELLPGVKSPPQGTDTTHFSILDRQGNRVAATLSINLPFGAAFVPPGTGVLLNNEMDDFVAKAGTPNSYGLVGATANAIAPGKRPLSSMSPTFVEGPQGIGILGTPGGSRIITMVALGILSYAAGEKPAVWVAKPRFHHQYLPDIIQHEAQAFDAQTTLQLQNNGHSLQLQERPYGNMQAILWDLHQNQVHAASDPRGIGSATVK